MEYIKSLLQNTILFLFRVLCQSILPKRDGFYGILIHTICKPFIRLSWQLFYSFGSYQIGNNEQWQYINYGFIPDDETKLIDDNNGTRNEKCGNACLQLYHEVISSVPINNTTHIVEIGCGRGGGASYIARHFQPASMTGIDISPTSIQVANTIHSTTTNTRNNNLVFKQGDALNIPLPDNTYDIVVNVESSHCYPDFRQFMKEVYRILKPNGYFVMADLRYIEGITRTENDMMNSGFKIQTNIDITKNVLKSMEYNTPARESLMKEITGGENTLLYKLFKDHLWNNFGALVGSPFYNAFVNGSFVYKRYVLQKVVIPSSSESNSSSTTHDHAKQQ